MFDTECVPVSARTSIRRLLKTQLNGTIPNNQTNDGVDLLLKINGDIDIFLQLYDPNIYEKTVLLINHIIIMDKLAECGKSTWESDDRHLYMHDLEAALGEFGSFSSSLDRKESIYYYAGCLFFKVHDYAKAKKWFSKSKAVFEKSTAGNDLSESERVRRDIFIAFCYEYTGCPEDAILFLLGVSSVDIFETAIYAHKNDIISAVVKPECTRNKYFLIKEILSFPEFKHDNIFANLLFKEDVHYFELEVTELIHVFAHCLSEHRTRTDNFEGSSYGKYEFESLIRLISTKLIDTLDDKYVTCKAIIRAEGGDRDAALEILPNPSTIVEPKESAEINFYRFYFTELFSDMFESEDDDVISTAGSAFYNYCVAESSNLDDDSKRDALLHYHIFEVKRRLRTKFEQILQAPNNRNNAFFNIDFDNIDDQWQESFYAVIQKSKDFSKGFSSFANAEIKKELHLLRLCLNILLEMKSNQLPLFFTNDEEGKDFDFEVGGNQLFELCKMFSASFSKGMRPIPRSNNHPPSAYRTYYINSLRFDTITDCAESYLEFDAWIQKLFAGEKVDYVNVEFEDQSSTTKIIFGDPEVVSNQCDNCYMRLMSNSQLNLRVFYLGQKSEGFMATPIVAFNCLKTCILMAFIYASVESVMDYICKPRPIYILAPLRDTGSYYFQAVNFDRFIPLQHEPSDIQVINSEGIGVIPRYSGPKVKEKLECYFLNETVRGSCCCAIKYENSKLFALRGSTFVEKTNINHQMVQYYYYEYAVKREKCRRYKTVHCGEQERCSINNLQYCEYVFRKTDALAHDKASSNPIAKQLLLDLIIVACKEDISDYDNLYVLEKSIITSIAQPLSFEIYFFNKDLSYWGCPKDWLSIGKMGENRNKKSNNSPAENETATPPNDLPHIEAYKDCISGLCTELLNEQKNSLDKWRKYFMKHEREDKIAKIADGKINLLNTIPPLIEHLKEEWLSKSPISDRDVESLKKDFFACATYKEIQQTLNQTRFE